MKIYMLRHGQTDWNIQRKVQGSSDIPLNEQGRKMAEETAQGLQQIPFDHIFASPLSRARETAEYIGKQIGKPLILDDRLKEIHFGEYEGITEKKLQEMGIAFHDMFFMHPDEFKPGSGGETIQDTVNRAGEFLREKIEPLEGSAENVLFVSHGELLHAMLVYMLDRPISGLWGEKKTQNCEVHIISYESGEYKLIEESKIVRKGEKI